jgi:hypothetical protein
MRNDNHKMKLDILAIFNRHTRVLKRRIKNLSFLLNILKKKEQELREKRFGSRANKSYTMGLDFAGRKILDEQQNFDYKQLASETERILNEEASRSVKQISTVAKLDENSIKLKVVDRRIQCKLAN